MLGKSKFGEEDMASLNKVQLIGRLGKDPELHHTPNGVSVCTFNIATSEFWEDEGERQESVEWHHIVIWNKQAENCAKYLAKGRQVYLEGKIQTKTWEDRDGIKRYSTQIKANSIKFLDGIVRDKGPIDEDSEGGVL